MISFRGFIFKGLTNNFKNNDKFSNYINSIYQSNVNNKDLNRCKCSKCNATGNFEIKGYYYRNIIICFTKVKIRITRVKCSSCNRTHSLFFEDIIPYFSLTSIESLKLYLNSFISNNHDYDALLRLKKRFSLFIKYLKSINGSIIDIQDSNDKTIKAINKSYLQIHLGSIILVT